MSNISEKKSSLGDKYRGPYLSEKKAAKLSTKENKRNNIEKKQNEYKTKGLNSSTKIKGDIETSITFYQTELSTAKEREATSKTEMEQIISKYKELLTPLNDNKIKVHIKNWIRDTKKKYEEHAENSKALQDITQQDLDLVAVKVSIETTQKVVEEYLKKIQEAWITWSSRIWASYKIRNAYNAQISEYDLYTKLYIIHLNAAIQYEKDNAAFNGIDTLEVVSAVQESAVEESVVKEPISSNAAFIAAAAVAVAISIAPEIQGYGNLVNAVEEAIEQLNESTESQQQVVDAFVSATEQREELEPIITEATATNTNRALELAQEANRKAAEVAEQAEAAAAAQLIPSGETPLDPSSSGQSDMENYLKQEGIRPPNNKRRTNNKKPKSEKNKKDEKDIIQSFGGKKKRKWHTKKKQRK